jgi:TolB-like protein/class 3 adenylate cyclase
MPDLAQRRLAAILAADVVGFSRLMETDEEDTLIRLKALRSSIVDPAIVSRGGRIFKTTGDGLLAEFPSVVEAVKCAAQVQIEMSARTAGESAERRIVFRIGVNLGDIMVEGDDIYGDGVNIAARIEGICEPGGVAISASAHEQVREKIEFPLVDCGEHKVKNIARPVHVYGIDLSQNGIAALGVAKRSPAKSTRYTWVWVLAIAAVMMAMGAAWIATAESAKNVRGSLVTMLRAKISSTPSRATIAVLPLTNQGNDATREYFSDGVTEDIIRALGRFSGLMVISHNSVQSYKERKASSEEISRELGVRYIVQGSVRQSEDKLRVVVELSDAEKGTQLWSEKYDGAGKDVFEIQDRIVRNIVGVLAVKITSLEAKRTATIPLESLEAYDMVLHARDLILRNDRSSNREARALATQAIKLVPNYAAGYITLSDAEWQRAEVGWMEDAEEGVRRSEELANRALLLDDLGVQARAHGRLAIIYSYRGQFEQALSEADLAIQINQSDADAQALRGSVLCWQGKIEESIAAYKIASYFDPRMSSNSAIVMSLAYYTAGRYQEALSTTGSFLARYQNLSFLHAIRAATFAQLGNVAGARAEAEKVRKFNPHFQVEQFGTRFRNPKHQAKIQDGLRKAGL